jgi:[acyl-carrier-protein] S-malonyltransferase
MAFAFVFPGQGSQSVGMLAGLAGTDPVVRSTFDEASTTLGYDLWQLTQEGPLERLNQTECAQPALLAAGIATLRLWEKRGGGEATAVSDIASVSSPHWLPPGRWTSRLPSTS